jgi:hypothetical protein
VCIVLLPTSSLLICCVPLYHQIFFIEFAFAICFCL